MTRYSEKPSFMSSIIIIELNWTSDKTTVTVNKPNFRCIKKKLCFCNIVFRFIISVLRKTFLEFEKYKNNEYLNLNNFFLCLSDIERKKNNIIQTKLLSFTYTFDDSLPQGIVFNKQITEVWHQFKKLSFYSSLILRFYTVYIIIYFSAISSINVIIFVN